MKPFVMKILPVEEIYSLRSRVLLPHHPIESVHFEGDNDTGTLHVGLIVDDKVIGCLSLMQSNSDIFDDVKKYQMRGMAVDSEYQHQGYGANMLKYAEWLALNRQATLIWLNARVSAIDFYKKSCYAEFGEKFMIPGVCEHIVMAKKLAYHSCKECEK